MIINLDSHFYFLVLDGHFDDVEDPSKTSPTPSVKTDERSGRKRLQFIPKNKSSAAAQKEDSSKKDYPLQILGKAIISLLDNPISFYWILKINLAITKIGLLD